MKFQFLLLGSILVFSLEAEAKIKKYFEPGGIEMIFETTGFGPHSVYSPDYPCLDCTLKATKLKEGRMVYSVDYRIDKDGFRETAGMKRPGKSKHFFLIDGSVAFGEGLKDEDTILDKINHRSKVYRAYGLGFLGHGPQHNWVTLSGDLLPKKIREKKGAAVLISHDQDIRRLSGAIDHIAYAAHFPNVVEVSPGVFENRGPFEESGTWLQKTLIKVCVPFHFCRNHLTRFYSAPDEKQIEKAAKLFESMEKLYRQKFDVESFTIFWTGSDETYRFLQSKTKIPFVKFRFEVGESMHPSAEGASQIVEKLFDEKILN